MSTDAGEIANGDQFKFSENWRGFRRGSLGSDEKVASPSSASLRPIMVGCCFAVQSDWKVLNSYTRGASYRFG